jgi:hypothetical protein
MDWVDRDDDRYGSLDRIAGHGLATARERRREDLAGGGTGNPATCGKPITRGPWAGRHCPCPAGEKTTHEGYGRCWPHGGKSARGRAEASWLAAHAFAQELDVNPWDALLMAVRIAAGKVQYCQWVIGAATSDLEIEGRFTRGADGLVVHPDTGEPLGAGQLRNLTFWNTKLEFWHGRLAQTAKWAIDAGVAAYEVARAETEAQNMARVLNATLEGVQGQVPEEVVAKMRALMRRELLAIDAEQGSIRASTDADAAIVDSTWQET